MLRQVLVVTLDDAATEAARLLPVGAVWRPDDLKSATLPHAKYHYAAALARTGTDAFVADVGVRLKSDPFNLIYGDADVEAPGLGGGLMTVAMDPVMGWSTMCETYQIPRAPPLSDWEYGWGWEWMLKRGEGKVLWYQWYVWCDRAMFAP